MKTLSNKTIVLIAVAPLGVYVVVGFIEEALGIHDVLPSIFSVFLDIITFVFTIYAFVRLYRLPDAPKASSVDNTTAN